MKNAHLITLVAIVILSFASFGQAWAQTELIVNGNFASGSTGWQLSGNFYADSRFSNCRSCPGYTYVSNPDGTPGNSLYGTLRQGITIPANATSVTFSFWYYITTQEVGSTPYDVLGIYVENSSGSIIATLGTLSNTRANSSYQQASFDLTSYKGQSIRILFLGTTDNSYPTTFRIDDVSVLAAINQKPTCSLTADKYSGNAPLTVTFSMSASDPDGSISVWGLSVEGDGDPEYSGAGNPPATQSHLYTTPGTYIVILGVLDDDGASDVDTVTIVVGENKPPTCALSPDKSSGKAPLTVTFSMSASDADGWITSWELLSGDGSPTYSGSGNPPSTKTHTYTSAGTYTAILGVTDNEGATFFDTKTINVDPPVRLPSVSTSASSNIDLTSATLNGNLDDTGGETCEVWFEWGLTTSYGHLTSKQSKSLAGSFSESISCLSCGTPYHFRACASNSKDTVYGSDRSFTTQICLVPFPTRGKGIWIVSIWELGETINQIINRLRATGVRWVAIKCGDSDSFWLRENGAMTIWLRQSGYGGFGEVIGEFHDAGINVYGWQYVYSYDRWEVPDVNEADVASIILDIPGIDGLIVDAECEYEEVDPGASCPLWEPTAQSKADIAMAYMEAIRARHLNKFIAYTTFPIIDFHTSFPYLEFGRYCDAVMPQAYWKFIGVTPEDMIYWMEEQWNTWHEIWQQQGYGDSVKPIIPIGQGSDVSGSEIIRFCDLVYDHGYRGVSLWEYAGMTPENWQAYQDWVWEITPADFDIDGDVDFADYAVLADQWMNENCAESNWCNGADLNKSGSVDLYDLAEFVDNWLAGVGP